MRITKKRPHRQNYSWAKPFSLKQGRPLASTRTRVLSLVLWIRTRRARYSPTSEWVRRGSWACVCVLERDRDTRSWRHTKMCRLQTGPRARYMAMGIHKCCFSYELANDIFQTAFRGEKKKALEIMIDSIRPVTIRKIFNDFLSIILSRETIPQNPFSSMVTFLIFVCFMNARNSPRSNGNVENACQTILFLWNRSGGK